MQRRVARFLKPFVILISCVTILAFALPAFAARDFKVSTDRTTYAPGSTVTIKLSNTGTESLHLVGTNLAAVVYVAETEGWKEVYTWAQKPGGVPDDLASGGVTTWTWNCKDNEGTLQPAGKYRVKVRITMPNKGYQADKYSQPFTLTTTSTGWSAKKEITVTSNMSTYHEKGVVNFTIKNIGDVALDTGNFSWIVYRHTASGVQSRSTHNSRPGGVPNPLLPGKSASWSWDMRNDQGDYVNADDYELEVKLPNVPDNGIEGNCFFKVIP
jgi:hypothetical protein